jgi:two-component system chemotaxis sensor kinase CheA
LDVVREAAERLDGEVTVRTEKEGGTTIELMVPLSLASFEGLLVEASGITAAIPIDAIHETTRVSSQQLVQSPAGGSILQGGDNIPFVPLARTIAPALTQLDGASGPWTAVIVKGQTARACLAVDRIIGTETVVLRPLPALAPAIACVAGASLDVEGNPRLVLEPDGLVAAAQGVRPESAAAEKARPSILIVDDSLTTRMLEQSILESAGYDADLACSGEEALEKARATRYALFLVDIEMPGMDGFTFIERIRVEPDLKGVPAILVTSRSSPDDQRRGREAGAQGFIIKSEFDQGMLLDRIRRLVG